MNSDGEKTHMGEPCHKNRDYSPNIYNDRNGRSILVYDHVTTCIPPSFTIVIIHDSCEYEER